MGGRAQNICISKLQFGQPHELLGPVIPAVNRHPNFQNDSQAKCPTELSPNLHRVLHPRTMVAAFGEIFLSHLVAKLF